MYVSCHLGVTAHGLLVKIRGFTQQTQIQRISYSVNGQFNETAKYGLYLLFSDYIATCWWRDCLSAGKPEFFWKKFAGF